MLRRTLRIVTAGGAVCLMIVTILAAERFAAAQQQRTVAIPEGARPLGPNDADRFTGLSRSLEPGNLRLTHRWFEPGARTAWHRHVAGQVIYVERGTGRVQQRGRAMRELSPGESEYTGPNVEHWHGAAPGREFYQIAINFGDQTTWLEKVDEATYTGR